jgi:biopolymer transport protein ExbD
MPVKLTSKSSTEEAARIEIVPLIDIMFFLLAAFMLVSLSMVNMQGVKVDLPSASTGTTETRQDFISVTVDKAGVAYLNKEPVGQNELVKALTMLQQTNREARVFISGDIEARHGDVIRVLDIVRAAGIQKVAFETRENAKASAP